MGCSEIAVFVSNKLKLSCCRVDNLNVASEVPVSVGCAELMESLVRNLGDIELVVAYTMSIQIGSQYLNIGLGSTAYRYSTGRNQHSQI
jgi:hypothetical protein